MVVYAIYHSYCLHRKLSKLETDRDPSFWEDISTMPDNVLDDVRELTSTQHAQLQHLHSQQSVLMAHIGELEAHIQHHLQGGEVGATRPGGIVNEEVMLIVNNQHLPEQGVVIEEHLPEQGVVIEEHLPEQEACT